MKSILKRSRLFAQLDDRALDNIASAATLRQVTPGEMIFQEGEPAHSFFVVGRGRVKVFKLSPEGKEQVLMIAGAGDSFAEAALFAGRLFPASAQALEECELLAISRARFVRLLGENPDLAVNLIGRLSELLRLMTRLIEGLSLSDVTTRLARFLCAYRVESTGRMPSEIMLSVKKTILAAQLGTIPETLSRSFAKLVREGMIQVHGPTITILDPDRLQRLADSGK
ncbi:MAG: Crp/Fnr family transcriptional regulator [Candidatus Zixiibacteriota bacterium]